MRRSVSRRLAFASAAVALASISIIVSCTGDSPLLVGVSGDGGPSGLDATPVPEDAPSGVGDSGPTDGGGPGPDVFVPPVPAEPFFLHFSQSSNTAGGGPFVRLDALQNTYVAFSFVGLVNIGGHSVSSLGKQDVAVVKLSPNGTVLWASTFGGEDSDVVSGLAVDGDGRAFIVGGFDSGSITFGTGTLTTNSGTHPFVASFDAAGTALTARDYAYGGGGGSCTRVDAAAGFVLVGCTVTNNMRLNAPGSAEVLVPGIGSGSNALFALLNHELEPTWANEIGGDLNDEVNGVAVSADGAMYGSLLAPKRPLDDTNKSLAGGVGSGDEATVVVRFNPANGNTQWAYPFVRNTADNSYVVVRTMYASSSGVTIAGELGGKMTFPGGVTATAAASDPGQDALVARIGLGGAQTRLLRSYGQADTSNSGAFAVGGDDGDTNVFLGAQSQSGLNIDGTVIPAPIPPNRQAFLATVLYPADAGAKPLVRYAAATGSSTRSFSTGVAFSNDFIVWAGTFNGAVAFDDAGAVTPSDAGSDGFVLAFKR